MTTMRHYHTKNAEDLIRQIESDDELSKEFEDAELASGRVVSVRVVAPEQETQPIRKNTHEIPV